MQGDTFMDELITTSSIASAAVSGFLSQGGDSSQAGGEPVTQATAEDEVEPAMQATAEDEVLGEEDVPAKDKAKKKNKVSKPPPSLASTVATGKMCSSPKH